MLHNVVIFANAAAEGAELINEANAISEKTVLITSSTELSGTDRVYAYSSGESVATKLNDIISVINSEKPELVLCEAGKDARLVAGYVAAAIGTSPLAEAMSLTVNGEVVETSRLVYGGMAIKVETASFPAVAVVGPGAFAAEEKVKESVVMQLPETSVCGLELVGISEISASAQNLAAAKKVVGVGRGLSSADNISDVEKLASIIGADVGCTRPVAEEEHWYGKERYIGVSGCMLKPNFYLAIGISGQIQHMVGVNKAGVIFAIDKNENAPIFKQADYCLIGDSSTAIRAIIDKL
ncbi:MAG: electron transfer flavoprotein subunit alpha/FixB family protein [Bacteroidia bacterium]|nr:electron transfer flavoprotein subunit alpha/FixB family protein [Bacteroidia bacterium]NCC69619.1 electron transfer flavoprotein subunit alpha/FixB family protein [Clostridia bacterium]